jgi:hypothetical protein
MKDYYEVSLYTGEDKKPVIKKTTSFAIAREWVLGYEHGVIEYRGEIISPMSKELKE